MQVKVVSDSRLLYPHENPNGIVSVQVLTESAPGRPFAAFEVLVEVYALPNGQVQLYLPARVNEIAQVISER